MHIRHVDVVDPDGERVLTDRRIVLDGDRIAAVTPDTSEPPAAGDRPRHAVPDRV